MQNSFIQLKLTQGKIVENSFSIFYPHILTY